MVRPCLCAKYLLLSDPFHCTSVRDEDADAQLGGNIQADAICAANEQVCACIRSICTYRKVSLYILERII